MTATAYDADYLAGLRDGEFHGEGDHPVAADEATGRTDVDNLYVAGWLSGDPHQVVISAGHGARVAKSLVRDHRVDEERFWEAVAQFWDLCAEEGTYGGEEGDPRRRVGPRGPRPRPGASRGGPTGDRSGATGHRDARGGANAATSRRPALLDSVLGEDVPEHPSPDAE